MIDFLLKNFPIPSSRGHNPLQLHPPLCQRLPVTNHYNQATEGDFSLENLESGSHTN